MYPTQRSHIHLHCSCAGASKKNVSQRQSKVGGQSIIPVETKKQKIYQVWQYTVPELKTPLVNWHVQVELAYPLDQGKGCMSPQSHSETST
jgi:homoserine kinase